MKLKTHYRIEINAGVGQDALGALIPATSRDAALSEISRVAVELFGGATIHRTAGVWQNPATGRVHNESSIAVVVLVEKPEKGPARARIARGINMLADVVKGTLSQATVIVSVSETKTAFH